MPRFIFASIAVAMTVLLSTAPLQAQSSRAPKADSQKQEIALLQEQSQEAYAAEKWAGVYVANMKLTQLLPYEPEYMINIIRACALLDRKTSAYHYMLKMQQQGMTYDFNSIDDTLLIRNTEAYEYINDLLVEAGTEKGVGTPAFTVPGNPANIQAIAWDEGRDQFLVGTMSEGTVMAVSADGASEVLLEANNENGLWSINGLAVDTVRNRLWVSSAATPLFAGFLPADKNRGALFEFNLETLEQVGRYNVPVDGLRHEPGNMAISDDGNVYVIDRATPLLYRKVPEGDRLELIFASPDLQGLSDITVAPDNSRIFISDTVKGILVIDPVAQQAALMSGPETMNLGGIQSIEYRNGQLFLVQGGFNPQRVIRLEIDASGYVVESVSPMAIALEDFSRPGAGAISGENLYYVANSGADDATGAVIMSTPLDAGVQVAPPELAEFEEAIKAKQKQQKEKE